MPDPIAENRRKQLNKLIEHFGTKAELARVITRAESALGGIGMTANQIQAWVPARGSSARAKAMTEQTARRIEKATCQIERWFDTTNGVGEVARNLIGLTNTEQARPLREGALAGRRIPVLSQLQAVTPRELTDAFTRGAQLESYVTKREVGPHAFALVITGDAMRPDLCPGDTVVSDPGVQPNPGNFVTATVDGELVVARYRMRGINTLGVMVFELQPTNHDYAAASSERSDCVITGTIVEYVRPLSL